MVIIRGWHLGQLTCPWLITLVQQVTCTIFYTSRYVPELCLHLLCLLEHLPLLGQLVAALSHLQVQLV